MIRENVLHGSYSSKFQAYVVYVDHNGTIGDKQKEGIMESFSPQTGRNLHIGVVRLNGEGSGIALNVLVPADHLGEFKMPKVGDVVWVEESRRDIGAPPIFLYSTYNSTVSADKVVGSNPVPQWGSFPGDKGDIASYRDHIRQFVPSRESNFKKKFIKSITGHRFRSFYKGNLAPDRYVVRGDSVFDIDGSVSREYLVEEGGYIVHGGDLEDDQGNYPNPLNVPSEREEDEDYKYTHRIFEPIDRVLTGNQYDNEEEFAEWYPTYESSTLKNKNYLAYQPVLDKTYLEGAEFERELPAAEEYQVVIHGNNKLLIQDQHGDGEQILITLKNQYDAGFTIVHNAEKGQIRIRDHMGQGVMMEADPDAPRVISWTANRQVIEQGSVKDVGEFTYIRNGSVFGDSETSFGTKTGVTKDDVSNQEFLMVSTSEIIGELGSRLSSGMSSLVGKAGSPGIYFRNNTDPDESSQEYSLYKAGANMVVEILQENLGVDGAVQESRLRQELDGEAVTQTTSIVHNNPDVAHSYEETISATPNDVTKSYEMERSGSDTITGSESITGPNTATLTRTLFSPDSSHTIIYTEDVSTPSVIVNLIDGGDPSGDFEMTPDEIKTVKYVGGDEVTTVKQTTSSIDIERAPDGGTFVINIGNDGRDGPINIGNPLTSALNIFADSMTIAAEDDMTISGDKEIVGPTDFIPAP